MKYHALHFEDYKDTFKSHLLENGAYFCIFRIFKKINLIKHIPDFSHQSQCVHHILLSICKKCFKFHDHGDFHVTSSRTTFFERVE